MLRAKLSLLLLAVLSLASSHRLYAFDDWQPINPDELKMTADAAHQGDAIILYHEETADDMTRHRYVYKRLKVLTEKGKDRASVEIPYDAKYVGIADIRARTIAPDGTITPLTGKAFNSTTVWTSGLAAYLHSGYTPDRRWKHRARGDYRGKLQGRDQQTGREHRNQRRWQRQRIDRDWMGGRRSPGAQATRPEN
jgi:hypothetical protein